MNKKQSRGIPAPFHAAVIFTVVISLFGTPLSEGIYYSWGLGDFFARLQTLFYSTSQYSNGSKQLQSKSTGLSSTKGGKKFSVFETGLDPTTDPPPPPPPPK
jgi:hypothetical protein